MAENATSSEEQVMELWQQALSGRSRKERQIAAHAFAVASQAVPDKVVAYADVLVSAVSRPESQTRWEALDALAHIAPYGPDKVAEAFDGVQECLFEEESGLVRLNAFLFLAALGSCGPDWSLKTWPLIDEAIQCLHGDEEYPAMLLAMVDFVQADIDPSVRQAVVDRLAFDAQSGKGEASKLARKVIQAAD
jgi:hypothetical protein